MKKIVYIGNKLSKKGKTQTSIETLGKHLMQEGFEVVSASDKVNKVSRLFDMVYTVFKNAKSTDYVIIDTRGGGSELNNACLVNTNLVIIPSALTTLDMTQGLATFEHTVKLLQALKTDLPVALLIQRVPVGKLTVSQRQSLAALSELPRCETLLHARDAYASMSSRGMLHLTYDVYATDLTKRFNASHVAIAIEEAKSLTNDILEALGDI